MLEENVYKKTKVMLTERKEWMGAEQSKRKAVKIEYLPLGRRSLYIRCP